MAEPRTEEETGEAIKTWLRQNGLYLVAGIVLGLLALFGWRAWQDYRQAQAEAASSRFDDLMTAARKDNAEKARSLGDELVEQYAGTPYAALGALALGKLALGEGDFEAAESRLRWAMQNGGAEVAALARLRLARVLVQDGRPAEALDLVKESPGQAYTPLYAELRGDIHADAGRTEEARRAYAEALEAAGPDYPAARTLQMKLNDLGGPLSS